jgi:hypothetical protein
MGLQTLSGILDGEARMAGWYLGLALLWWGNQVKDFKDSKDIQTGRKKASRVS